MSVNIGTVEELQDFVSRVNAGETSLDAVLTADIDLSGVTWTPIGTSTYPYAGTFDGNGHKIENLSISYSIIGSYGVLFNYNNGATIKNLNIDSLIATGTYSNVGNSALYTCIIGNMKSTTIDSMMFTNCTLSSTAVTNQYGGWVSCSIFGPLSSGDNIITNCIVADSVFNITGNGRIFWLPTGVFEVQPDGKYYSIISNCYCENVTINRNCSNVAHSDYSLLNGCNSYGNISNCMVLSANGTFSYRIASRGTHTNNYCDSSITGYSPIGVDTVNGADVSSSIYSQQEFWDGTGVSGTTYLSWDFTDTWYWDSTTNLPKLQIFKPIPSVDISDGTTWSNGTPYVYDTEWLQGEKLHVYISSGWTEKV